MKADKCGQELPNKELTEAKAPIRGEHAKKSLKFSPKLKHLISLRLKDSTFHSRLAKITESEFKFKYILPG